MPDPRLKRYVRNAGATVLGIVVAGGVVVTTMTYRGETVEVADCDAETFGERYFAAREDADGLPILAGVSPSMLAGRCHKPTPLSWTDGQGRVWFIWQCHCEGNLCCASMDHAQYLGADRADLIAKAASLGGRSLSKLDFFCALDPVGCSSRDGPEPCRRPVALIPSERRPPEAEWSLCHNWAPRERAE